MFASLNSRLYTVAALREIAERMNIAVPGKATKPVIAELIVAGIESAHDDALDMDDDFDSSATFTENGDGSFSRVDVSAGIVAQVAKPLDRQSARVGAYIAQRGTYKLTAAQWRRIRKNNKRHGLTTAINTATSLVTVEYV